jgi:splicing factor 3A subunit 3
MKCLKIPNTVHFKGVTGIEEALKLHQTLLQNKKKEVFKPEFEEEYEDESGNVVNKRMYDDLVKQGIIQK